MTARLGLWLVVMALAGCDKKTAPAAGAPTPPGPAAAVAPGATSGGLSCSYENVADGPSIMLQGGAAGSPFTGIRVDVDIDGSSVKSQDGTGFSAKPGAEWPLGRYTATFDGQETVVEITGKAEGGDPKRHFKGTASLKAAPTKPIVCYTF